MVKTLNKPTNPIIVLISTWFLIICLIATCSAKEKAKAFPVTPVKKSNNSKWRIGYLEGGDYSEYHRTMNATVQGLMSLGWIEQQEIQLPGEATGEALWEYYSKNLKSDTLEFVADGFYSAGWNQEARKKVKQDLVTRLKEKRDLDLIIAMGTWAGIDLSKGEHQTPTIVLAVSDALTSGIIKSFKYSGNDYIHARVDPDRFERQVRIFHTIIGFETLGMVYRNDLEGRSYAAVDKVKRVARERGFNIQACFLADEAELADDELRLIDCFRKLSLEVDAIYVTSQKAVNPGTVPILAKISKEGRVPTFSQSGMEEVRKGLLLSISQAGFIFVGKFYAESIAKVLNGALPGELEQIFEDPSKISINLTTAEAIGFYPSLDVLSSADEIFRETQQETEQLTNEEHPDTIVPVE